MTYLTIRFLKKIGLVWDVVPRRRQVGVAKSTCGGTKRDNLDIKIGLWQQSPR
jgi:hypothetical protein